MSLHYGTEILLPAGGAVEKALVWLILRSHCDFCQMCGQVLLGERKGSREAAKVSFFRRRQARWDFADLALICRVLQRTKSWRSSWWTVESRPKFAWSGERSLWGKQLDGTRFEHGSAIDGSNEDGEMRFERVKGGARWWQSNNAT